MTAPISPPDPEIAAAAIAGPRQSPVYADQQLRLISALVVLMALGVFLALPFVLSIGSVVFLPLVSAIILTVVLSPLADRLAAWGIPNFLASLLSLIALIALLAIALSVVLLPAASLFDAAPTMVRQVGKHFSELKGSFAWIGEINRQLAAIIGTPDAREVVLAGPSVIEQLALATPTVLLELLLTLILTFFMIESRIRLRHRLLLDRQQVGASLKAARALREVQDRVADYILTVSVINAGVGVVVALGAWLLGLGAPVMWGGLAMLLNFVPYIGPLVMLSLLTLFGLGSAEAPLVGLIPAAAYLGLHTVESNVITPTVLGVRFTTNPVMILLALTYFGWIWGVVGALLSVPILLTLTALVEHLGRPNFVGFLFGEPLFASNVLESHGEI